MKSAMRRKAAKKSSMKKSRAMRKAKRVSKIAKGKRAKSAVFAGRKAKTVGGLTKADLIRNKQGKVVSKKQSAQAKKKSKHFVKWAAAFMRARRDLKIKGFAPCKGALLAKTRQDYKK